MGNRVNPNDSFEAAYCKVSEADDIAMKHIEELVALSEQIDDKNILGGGGILFDLDQIQLYGRAINRFLVEYCSGNHHTMLLVLRAFRLNMMNVDQFQQLITTLFLPKSLAPAIKFDVAELTKKVEECLPHLASNKTKARSAIVRAVKSQHTPADKPEQPAKIVDVTPRDVQQSASRVTHERDTAPISPGDSDKVEQIEPTGAEGPEFDQ